MIGASEMMNAIKCHGRGARADPHENQRRNGDDRHRLQQDRVRIEHSAHPARLRENQGDHHADHDAGDEAASDSSAVIASEVSSDGKRATTARATAQGEGSM